MRENTSTEWVNKEVDSEGNFNRQKNQFETPFGEGEGKLPVELGRYRLLWAPVCPWAHRSVIVRRLMTVLTIWYLTVWTGWKKGLQTRDTYLVTD